MKENQCWGLYPAPQDQESKFADWNDQISSFIKASEKPVLPRGYGRSYGDSCLNSNGVLLHGTGLNRILKFDPKAGTICVESGASLFDLIRFLVPRGWFLPVTPGTQHVSLGGALANDVHGKNHHRMGCFGHHVLSFEIHRSDGSVTICSPTKNSELFYASIGGLGLTGFVSWIEFQCIPVKNAWVDQEVQKFRNLREFFHWNQVFEAKYSYVVAWIDVLGRGSKFGRGHLIGGDHNMNPNRPIMPPEGPSLSVPFFFPPWVLNSWSLKTFNEFYFRKFSSENLKNTAGFKGFFYPLDSISGWNKIYGKKGFIQHQCVVPLSGGDRAIEEILDFTSRRGLGSFLAVLKTFGPKASLSPMSFPREGYTLALDFAVGDGKIFRVLDEVDKIVVGAGGAIYPAKDARMSKATFLASFPKFEDFLKFIDPKFSSDFLRRVSL